MIETLQGQILISSSLSSHVCPSSFSSSSENKCFHLSSQGCRENERAAPCDALYVHQKWAPKAALGDGSFCPAPGCSMMGSWEMCTSLSRGESRVHRCQGPQPTFPGGLNKLHPPHLPSGTSPDPLSLSLPPHKHSHTHFL